MTINLNKLNDLESESRHKTLTGRDSCVLLLQGCIQTMFLPSIIRDIFDHLVQESTFDVSIEGDINSEEGYDDFSGQHNYDSDG